MFQSSEAIKINQKYQAGERNFRNIQLRRLDLRGLDLSNADLRGADLSYSNLRDVNLSGADLQDAYLNEADFTGANFEGANLQNASLIKAYLMKANFQKANLRDSYLTSSYAIKSNFEEANFEGAYLNRTQLTGAKFKNAKYNNKTRFDGLFDPKKLGMKEVTELNLSIQSTKGINNQQNISVNNEVNIEQLLNLLEHIIDVSHQYLGKKMVIKYWHSSQPEAEFLNQFSLNKSGYLEFSGNLQAKVNQEELQQVKEWLKSYIKSCTQIFPNFPKMIDRQQLSLIFAASSSKKKIKSYRMNYSLPIKENAPHLVYV